MKEVGNKMRTVSNEGVNLQVVLRAGSGDLRAFVVLLATTMHDLEEEVDRVAILSLQLTTSVAQTKDWLLRAGRASCH